MKHIQLSKRKLEKKEKNTKHEKSTNATHKPHASLTAASLLWARR